MLHAARVPAASLLIWAAASNRHPLVQVAPGALANSTPRCHSSAAAINMAQPGEARPRVAVAQMTSVGDPLANFATCKSLAEQAAAAGCCMLFLPECCSFIGSEPQESLAQAQPLEGPAMERFRQLARDTGLWLSLGGFQEAGPEHPAKLRNCHVILDGSGRTVAAYRKVHLFDVHVPNGPLLMESRTTAPGSELVACDSPAGRLGLSVCYDLRFPALYEALTWRLEAQVLLVPSAFTKVTGAAHWEVLLRARAIESQAFVIAAAQAGRHNTQRESYGHSLIIDPWGTVIAWLDDPAATGIAVAELDFGLLAAVRAKMPIAAHRAAGQRRLGGQLRSSG